MSLSLIWAKVLAGLLSASKLVGAFLIYMAGKNAARSEAKLEQATDAATKQKKYAEIATDETRDTLGKLKDGSF